MNIQTELNQGAGLRGSLCDMHETDVVMKEWGKGGARLNTVRTCGRASVEQRTSVV